MPRRQARASYPSPFHMATNQDIWPPSKMPQNQPSLASSRESCATAHSPAKSRASRSRPPTDDTSPACPPASLPHPTSMAFGDWSTTPHEKYPWCWPARAPPSSKMAVPPPRSWTPTRSRRRSAPPQSSSPRTTSHSTMRCAAMRPIQTCAARVGRSGSTSKSPDPTIHMTTSGTGTSRQRKSSASTRFAPTASCARFDGHWRPTPTTGPGISALPPSRRFARSIASRRPNMPRQKESCRRPGNPSCKPRSRPTAASPMPKSRSWRMP